MAKKNDKGNEDYLDDFDFDKYQEMNLPEKESKEGLEDYPKKEQEEQEKKDYLDEFPSQQPQGKQQYSQPLMFQNEGKENLIVDLLRVDWQRIEHIIRGHKPKTDESGNEYFAMMDDHYLNENGVNSILHYLSFYLSKDIKLGRYSAEQVQNIMKNFSTQFTDWFYDNLEEFGLNTPKKKKMSKMFVQSIIDLVDSAYSHAIEGKTIELMLKQFSVMQQEPLSEQGYNPNQNNQQRQKPSVFQRVFG